MKIQIDIPKDLNKKLKVHKANNEFKSLKETILNILNKYFRENDI